MFPIPGEVEGRGTGDRKVDVGITQIARVEIGGAFLENQTFYVIPLDRSRRSKAAPRSASSATRCSAASSRASDGLRGWFDLDTGSRRSRSRPRFSATAGSGVGGATRAQLARVNHLRFADFEVREPETLLSVQKAGAFAATDITGNIGGGILKRFDLTLDYEHSRIYFEANSAFGTRDVFDRSGMWLNDAGDALQVMDVTRVPAERMGIRSGERVRAIDGRLVDTGDLLRVRTSFRSEAAGTRIQLSIEAQDGARREVTLALEELV